ncbi:L-ascorbate oxidase [Actinidia chinensis var. chinensis]|uniref:L-ascorbate oxidase n=1 Tax=Actinidia chinensis var. chinensis TaxID=1590841 RepID=A0A2R6PBE4_ACTCC|nr:L-ascorbate oxidase [Actinidia chinensis var. chinensis]
MMRRGDQLLLGFFFCLFLSLAFAEGGRIRHYKWEVKYEYKSPDCYKKLVIAINSRTPGPTIEAEQYDTVVVELKNGLLTENVAIHWHGIQQIGTPWFDGTEGVTQCPILPGDTFVYKFVVDRPGTYLYHAHYGMQREAGLYGLIRVALPPGVSEPFHMITIEASSLMTGTTKALMNKPLDYLPWTLSLLIHGKGSFNCFTPGIQSGLCNATKLECSPYVLTVVPGKTYRLRIASLTALSALSFQIEGHNMTVVEADGHYVEPFAVKNLFIYPGETYSVLITTDQVPSRNYWAVTNVVSRNSTTPNGLAIFNYFPNHPGRSPPTVPPVAPVWNDVDSRLAQSLAIRARQGYIHHPPQLVASLSRHRNLSPSVRVARKLCVYAVLYLAACLARLGSSVVIVTVLVVRNMR